VGLSDNEAKIYLAMLELGPATALSIASNARINRPTAYAQIDSLKKKGLVKDKKQGMKTLFVAESPEKLEFLINKQKAELEVRREELAQAMPELMAAFSLTGEKPIVRYFEGKEGLTKVRREVLQCKEKIIRAISSIAESPDALSSKPSERLKRGIRSKFIYTSKMGPILKKLDKPNLLRESKYVSAKKLPIMFDFTAFDDKVVFEILRGKIGGIIIQDKNIAQSFKNLFDFVWSSIPE
jgi:sugar-specific transcriptional regulator TrmB